MPGSETAEQFQPIPEPLFPKTEPLMHQTKTSFNRVAGAPFLLAGPPSSTLDHLLSASIYSQLRSVPPRTALNLFISAKPDGGSSRPAASTSGLITPNHGHSFAEAARCEIKSVQSHSVAFNRAHSCSIALNRTQNFEFWALRLTRVNKLRSTSYMSRKSFALSFLTVVAFSFATIAAPSADDVMKDALAKAQVTGKNVFLHIGAPR
jgi:hypothetical protein